MRGAQSRLFPRARRSGPYDESVTAYWSRKRVRFAQPRTFRATGKRLGSGDPPGLQNRRSSFRATVCSTRTRFRQTPSQSRTLLSRITACMRTSPVVVVTGASAGLGRAIAHSFAKGGARVGLIARNPEALNAAREECDELGGRAHWVATDVSDPDAVERAAAEIEQRLGPIDIWINNAMVSVFSPVKEMEAADYKRVTDVLYLGFVHGTLAALRRMLPRDRGTIVQVGSALAYRSIPLQSAYCAATSPSGGPQAAPLGMTPTYIEKPFP